MELSLRIKNAGITADFRSCKVPGVHTGQTLANHFNPSKDRRESILILADQNLELPLQDPLASHGLPAESRLVIVTPEAVRERMQAQRVRAMQEFKAAVRMGKFRVTQESQKNLLVGTCASSITVCTLQGSIFTNPARLLGSLKDTNFMNVKLVPTQLTSLLQRMLPYVPGARIRAAVDAVILKLGAAKVGMFMSHITKAAAGLAVALTSTVLLDAVIGWICGMSQRGTWAEYWWRILTCIWPQALTSLLLPLVGVTGGALVASTFFVTLVAGILLDRHGERQRIQTIQKAADFHQAYWVKRDATGKEVDVTDEEFRAAGLTSFRCGVLHEVPPPDKLVVSCFGHIYNIDGIKDWIQERGMCPYGNGPLSLAHIFPWPEGAAVIHEIAAVRGWRAADIAL